MYIHVHVHKKMYIYICISHTSTNMDAATSSTITFGICRFLKTSCLFYIALFICIFLKQVCVRESCHVCVLQCDAVCCSVTQCVAVCCSVLHCVAVFCIGFRCMGETVYVCERHGACERDMVCVRE